MFGIGGFELFLILLFGFLIFGPDKLPAMAKTLGKAIAKFRNAQEEMSGVLKGEMVFDKDAEDPFKNPLDALDEAAAKAEQDGEGTADKADAAPAKPESFAERKARYDKERAERKAAEAEELKKKEEEERKAAAEKRKAEAAKKREEAAAKRKAEAEAKKAAEEAKAVTEAADDVPVAGVAKAADEKKEA